MSEAEKAKYLKIRKDIEKQEQEFQQESQKKRKSKRLLIK